MRSRSGLVERPVRLLADVDAVERRLRQVDVAVLDERRAGGGRRTSAAASRCGGRRSRRPSAGRSCGSAARSISKSSPTPQPSAETMSCSSLFASTFCSDACSALSTLPRSGRIACVLRSRPCLAEPPARVALDDEQLALAGIGRRAVGELARQVEPVRDRRLARDRLRRRARRLARRAPRGRCARRSARPRSCSRAGSFSSAGRTTPSTCACASGLLSRSLVCPWNCGSWM